MSDRHRARTSASRIAIALSTDAADLSGTRSILQERLGLWALAVGVLSSAFYLLNFLTAPLLPPGLRLADFYLHPGPMLHLLVSLLFLAAWLIVRRVPLSLRTLRALDPGLLVIGCALYAWMGLAIGRLHQELGTGPDLGLYAGLLASANTVNARAIIVPSTPSRTLWASTAAMLPMVIAAAIAGGLPIVVIETAAWCAVSVAVATVGSRVIYGLRNEAARVRRLGQYTLEEKIGAGGMGVVYRASHAMLRRPTAIKLLPPDRAGEANLARFEREVQLTSELSHPNTVAIYDYGRTPDGIFYYAMEYLEGINLEELVRRDGPQSAGRVIYVLRQVCGALAEAHRHGLLHRDIKPANIILTERGGEPDVAKVVDFGLVKPIAADGPEITMSASLVLAGTPLYMPPEALTSPGAADARSDLYAVGAVGYFLLTGQPLFEARTVAEAFGHHLHTAPVPPSRRVAHSIPGDLEALILRCLSKDVNERPADARTLARALSQCADAKAWTTEHAAEWWRSFRESAASQPATVTAPDPTIDGSQRLTVSIDLTERTRA